MSRPAGGLYAKGVEEKAYAAAGVDIAARSKFAAGLPAILAQARRPEVLSDAGPFSGLFRLGGRYRDPVLAASADGIGTKVKLRLAANRLDLCGPTSSATASTTSWRAAHEPLFFLDYIAGNGLTNEQKTDHRRRRGPRLRRTELRAPRRRNSRHARRLCPGRIRPRRLHRRRRRTRPDHRWLADVPGDVLVGIPSSGLHTNGFSLARRVLNVANGETAEETRARLDERPPSLEGQSLGEALLATHRPYNQHVAPMLDRVHGIAHITRRRLRRNVPRILPRASPPVSIPARGRCCHLPPHPAARRNRRRGDVRSLQHGHRARARWSRRRTRAACATRSRRRSISGDIIEDTGRRVELRGL